MIPLPEKVTNFLKLKNDLDMIAIKSDTLSLINLFVQLIRYRERHAIITRSTHERDMRQKAWDRYSDIQLGFSFVNMVKLSQDWRFFVAYISCVWDA